LDLLRGITYNLRGLWIGLKTPKLLFLGLIRFAVIVIITIFSTSLILAYHHEILNMVWVRPESHWVIWLWYIISWLLSLFLVGVAGVLSYIISQILFSVIIMDQMSRIIELKMTGQIKEPKKTSLLRLFFYLIKQEIPRTFIPVLLSILITIFGLLTPLGPVVLLLTSAITIIFLTWDNTDLVPARRLIPFRNRFRFLLKSLPFHLGFGLLFLIPGVNLLLLSFAPIGATRYYLERCDEKK